MKTKFPSQKKLFDQKGPKWRADHLNWAEELVNVKDSPVRTSLKNKTRNFNSYSGKIQRTEYESILNPNNLKKYYIPDEIQHYPIAVPYINVLIGEELDRRFEWKAIITNPTTISQIEKDKNKRLLTKIAELVQNTNISEEEAEEQLKNEIKYLNFEYQDVKEKQANLLLKHFIKELDLKLKFNQGFKNVTLVSEEAYIGDVINGRPTIEVLDPRKVFVLRSGESNKFEDADIIAIFDYISPGQANDIYYKDLTDAQIKKLEDLGSGNDEFNGTNLERDEHGINIFRNEVLQDMLNTADVLGGDSYENFRQQSEVDDFGNIRRIRLFWKSKKMIQKIKSYDPETGAEKLDYHSESYIPNKKLGEESEKYWVSQWWEGCRLGKDIDPYVRPRTLQFNKFSDPGYNHPGIVGQIYTSNSMKPASMMDRAMPYQLLYDATMLRVTEGLSKYFGSMPVIDYAEIPEGWDVEKWLYFARKAGVAVKDSFKEGKKGQALGKLAGGLSGSQNVMNQSGLGDYIQQQINILSFIETQMGRIIGVPPQRLGDIQNRETVGGVERAVTQSSFITNEMYKIHDNVKKRVLTMLLELCKTAYKDNPQKFQYISDDYLNQTFEIDNEFIEEEYGLLVDNDQDITKLEQQLEGLTQAALQNQLIRFSDVFKIYNSSSMSEKQRIIEKSEADIQKRQEEQSKRESEIAKAQLQQNAEIESQRIAREDKATADKLALDKYKIDQDNLTKRIGLNDSAYDEKELIKISEELELKYKQHEDEMLLKMKDLNEKIRNNKAKEKLDGKKIDKMTTNKTAPKK